MGENILDQSWLHLQLCIDHPMFSNLWI